MNQHGTTIRDLVLRTRTVRRFQEDTPVAPETLLALVDLARLAPCAGNKQPFKYALSSSRRINELVFAHLRWAAYLTDWNGPEPGERPAAYIVICRDSVISNALNSDQGFAVQNILLGATELGLGSCVIASFVREKIREIMQIPEQLDPIWVLAFGVPKETVVIEPLGPDGDVKYWRDEARVHHVPKRLLSDLLITQFTEEKG
jgi:nitroreductase